MIINKRQLKLLIQKKLKEKRPRMTRVAESAVNNIAAETMVFMDKFIDGYIHRAPSIGVTLK
jgi:hypothetical protein